MSQGENSAILEDISKEYSRSFHGVNYIVNVSVVGLVLYFEVEQTSTNERWSAELTSQYVEEISLKAGNFKRFPLFIKMLCSSLSNESETVFLDLLTSSDLESMKAKKSTTANSAPPAAAATSALSSNKKRYAILTYSGEFDRVHYPLPLTLEDKPNFEAMKRTIKRLRTQLANSIPLYDTTKAENNNNIANITSNGGEKDKEMKQLVRTLRVENNELRHKLRTLENAARARESGGASTHGAANFITKSEEANLNTKLIRQKDVLKKDLLKVTQAYDKLYSEFSKMKRSFYSSGGPGPTAGSRSSSPLPTATLLSRGKAGGGTPQRSQQPPARGSSRSLLSQSPTGSRRGATSADRSAANTRARVRSPSPGTAGQSARSRGIGKCSRYRCPIDIPMHTLLTDR